MLGVNVFSLGNDMNQMRNKTKVIDIVTQSEAATETSSVPTSVDAIGVSDNKAVPIGLPVPVVGFFGLLTGAKATM